MNKIEVLDRNTIDKIAAGEVVERPASVVKELVENAVDSGANAITVEIKNGGIEFVRITDNGCGIPSDQVRTAFLRHATSKLRSISDLASIASLGFRGEALSSICAVSQVELITREAGSVTGIRYIIHGGVEKSFEEIGAPFGTTFIMRNLFYNTPARAKFLKSQVSETNAVTSIVEQLALSHPEISFKYIVNGSTKLYTSGSGNLMETVYSVYGRDAAKQLVAISYNGENVNISGFLGRAEASRGNRNLEIYFVNGRYVHDKIISRAIEDGYHGNLMQHRYPFTVLNLDVDKDKVDVNVHPSKLEVRFSKQQEIYNEISDAIRQTLLENQSIPQASFEKKTGFKPQASILEKPVKTTGNAGSHDATVSNKIAHSQEINAIDKTDGVQKTGSADSINKFEGTQKSVSNDNIVNLTAENVRIEKKSIPEPFEYNRREALKTVPELVAEKQISLFENDKVSAEKSKQYRIIGQVFETYFLVELEDKLYIIDQHAAHEKIIYERLMKSMADHKATSQMLMPSVVLSLTRAEAEILRANMDVFESFGFEIEEFGGSEFRITASPADLYNADTDELIKETLADLDDVSSGERRIISERIALRSCKAAVKANMKLSMLEARKLIDELLMLDDPYHCPHGRPVIISFSHYELDRKFKRIL